MRETLESIKEILMEYSLTTETQGQEELPLLLRMQQKMELDEELLFVLPAFPAKSPSQHKTSGQLPDFGEVLALKNLQSFCDRITELYPTGAKVAICSDGRVFSDVVYVSDENIDRYGEGIKDILAEYNLKSIVVYSMDDFYPGYGPEELRKILMEFYAVSLERMKELVQTEANSRRLFNGIHRFLLEDAAVIFPDRSRNSLNKETKTRAYELLRRSDAWSSLLNEHFRDTLRLSIHPHPLGHEKFGIKLVPSSDKWATPWHNVAVKIKNRFELMHFKEALEFKAVRRLERDKYAYFEIPALQ